MALDTDRTTFNQNKQNRTSLEHKNAHTPEVEIARQIVQVLGSRSVERERSRGADPDGVGGHNHLDALRQHGQFRLALQQGVVCSVNFPESTLFLSCMAMTMTKGIKGIWLKIEVYEDLQCP